MGRVCGRVSDAGCYYHLGSNEKAKMIVFVDSLDIRKVPSSFPLRQGRYRTSVSKSVGGGTSISSIEEQAKRKYGPAASVTQQRGKVIVEFFKDEYVVDLDVTEIWRLVRESGLSLYYKDNRFYLGEQR